MKSLLNTSMHSFIQPRYTSTKVKISMSRLSKYGPHLLSSSMQRDFKYPREDYFAKKVAGFGNKSNCMAVAAADFWEAAVVVYGNKKTNKQTKNNQQNITNISKT